MSPSAPPRRIILDTDPSAGVPGADVDDILAIAVALACSELHVEGITVVAGNVELTDGLPSALATLEALGRTDVAVYAGAAHALMREREEIARFLRTRRDDPLVHALWRDVPRPTAAAAPHPGRAAQFIVDAVMSAPGEITLVPIGPLTNVAIALLLEPRVATAVREIVFMGGNIRGNHPGASQVEFNLANDPDAAHVVFRSGAPLTMIGLDVTTQTHLTLDQLHQATASGSVAARFVRRLGEPWIRFVQERRSIPGCWLHDPLALVAAFDRPVVATERMEVGVELRGEATYGQTIGRRLQPGQMGGGLRHPCGGPVDVAVTVDEPRFMRQFLPALTRALA
jgi:inosine-uridine nucleoside N-ribohydrolase